MWPFSSSSSKRISKFKLDKLLREIRILEQREREYVKGLFSQYASGGISKLEVQEAIRRMKFDKSDNIDTHEAEAIKQKLLEFLR